MIYINKFLEGAKNLTLTEKTITDEEGKERTPTLTTTKNFLNSYKQIFYKKTNSNLFIETLDASAEDIQQFIKKNNLHE